MGIVYEVFSDGVWKRVSGEEYELFKGCKRTHPAGIPAAFYTVTNMLLAYGGNRL